MDTVNTPIRTHTAQRLGLRPPEMPGRLDFRRDLTGEQRTEIERAWLLHRDVLPVVDEPRSQWRYTGNEDIPPWYPQTSAGYFRAISSGDIRPTPCGPDDFTRPRVEPQSAPRRRWWHRRNR